MEKRNSERHKTGDKYKGKIILVDAVTIKNISLAGIHLETIEELTPDNVCRTEITSSDNQKITPLCEVVWSSLMRRINEKDRTISIYGIGLKFIDLTDNEKQFLEKKMQ